MTTWWPRKPQPPMTSTRPRVGFELSVTAMFTFDVREPRTGGIVRLVGWCCWCYTVRADDGGSGEGGENSSPWAPVLEVKLVVAEPELPPSTLHLFCR